MRARDLLRDVDHPAGGHRRGTTCSDGDGVERIGDDGTTPDEGDEE